MKTIIQYFQYLIGLAGFFLIGTMPLLAQESKPDSTMEAMKAAKKAVKNTFEGNYIADNQTVIVPVKGTFEFDFQHRFGLVNKNGIKNLFGLYAGANIRMACSYVIMKNLQLGFGLTSSPMQLDGNVKYSIIQQNKDNSMPVSVTWFSNVVLDVRDKSNFFNYTDRFSYFHQIIIARKISDKISI